MQDASAVILVLLLVSALVALAIYNRTGARGEKLRSRREASEFGVSGSMSVSVILDSASTYMVGKGYTVESRGESSVTFARRLKPDWQKAIIFLLLFLLPGILYIIFGAHTERSTVVVVNDKESNLITIGGERYGGIRDLRNWRETLN